MSRSFRKYPIWKERNDKIAKKQANKKVRKSFCFNGGFFKKLFEQWSICDWKYSPNKLKRESKKDLSK